MPKPSSRAAPFTPWTLRCRAGPCSVATVVLLLVVLLFSFWLISSVPSCTWSSASTACRTSGLSTSWLLAEKRALRLGFLGPCLGDRGLVLVDTDPAGRVKCTAKGSAATRDAERVLGCHRRFASHLAPVVGELAGSAGAKSFASVVRQSNNAERASFVSPMLEGGVWRPVAACWTCFVPFPAVPREL